MLRAYGDGTLFGEAYGPGPVRVVFLHGWRRSSRDFAAAATSLAASGVASVALDLAGFGASPPPLRATGARGYAPGVARALADLGVGPVVVVGHSFGGRVATVVAAERPDLVAALVLTGVPLVRLAPVSSVPWRYRLIRRARRLGLVSDAALERARQRYGSSDYRAASGVMRGVLVAMVGESYEAELARVTAPVRLLWGSCDEEVPLEVAERARALLSARATLSVLAGVGHLVPTEDPAALAAVVLEALA